MSDCVVVDTRYSGYDVTSGKTAIRPNNLKATSSVQLEYLSMLPVSVLVVDSDRIGSTVKQKSWFY